MTQRHQPVDCGCRPGSVHECDPLCSCGKFDCGSCPLCLHRAHQPGQCATPSIDGCTCGMTRRQQRRHYRRLWIAEQLEDLADRIRYWGRP